MVEEWVADEREREVRAQERRPRGSRTRPRARRPARRPRAGRSRPTRAGRCARRRARRRCRRGRSPSARIRQARPAVSTVRSAAWSAVNFDGHFVTSESGWPTKHVALLAHVDDHLAPLAERVRHRARRSGRARRPCRCGRCTRKRVDGPACAYEPLRDLAGQLVGLARLGAAASWLGVARLAGRRRSSCRRARRPAARAQLSATTRRILRLRAGSIATQYADPGGAGSRPIPVGGLTRHNGRERTPAKPYRPLRRSLLSGRT